MPSSIKCNKCNLLTGLKNQKRETEKNRTHVKKQKILHNVDRTLEEILKVRVQEFLGCCGYLSKEKSL